MATNHQRSNRIARFVRWGALFAIWALITHVTVEHQRLGGGPEGAPTVDALCPFGGLATLYRVCAGGGYLQRVFPSSIVLLVGTLLSALVLRRAFCGWICPLGAMQELFAGIGRRLNLRRSLLHNPVDGIGRVAKYIVLVLVIALTWLTGELVFRPFDPWAAYAHVTAGIAELRDEFLVGSVLLAVTVVGSVVLERSWCRYLCPLGGLLGAVSRAGATRVVRTEDSCIHCGRCDKACPVDISVQGVVEVRNAECLTCGECVACCPVPDTLGMRIGPRPVPNLVVGILALAIFFGAVSGSKVLGFWESRPASIQQIIGEGETRDPANIRGFMTLEQVARSFGLSTDEITSSAGLPPDTPVDEPVKDVVAPLGLETEDVREAVARLLGQSGDAPAPPPPSPAPAGAATGDHAPEADIAGTDTLEEVGEAYGVPVDVLLEELDLPADTPHDKPLKEIMRPLGRHVTEVREAVEALKAETPE